MADIPSYEMGTLHMDKDGIIVVNTRFEHIMAARVYRSPSSGDGIGIIQVQSGGKAM